MRIFKAQKELKKYLETEGSSGSVGFVPTMGALHQGHLSLIKESIKENDLTVCSIFINPKQFNQASDFENYPVTHDQDIRMLEEIGCDILYLPSSTEDVYMHEIPLSVDVSLFENVMEGKYRKGHFEGVVRVVKLLFEIVQPTRAYFGLKDYQQYLVIKEMTRQLGLPISIVGCDIVREQDGLAMSSRNMRLSESHREEALILKEALDFAKEHYLELPTDKLKENCLSILSKYSVPEYFEICDSYTLHTTDSSIQTKNVRAFTAAVVGEVRLIDNIEIC